MSFPTTALGVGARIIILLRYVPNKGRIMGYQPATEQIRRISAALIAFYRKRWLEWGQSDDRQLPDHLNLIEFRASDCDTDELFEAFVKANEALERKAYGCGQHHFGIGYLAKRPDREDGLIRALVMVEPDQVEGFRIAAGELPGSRSDLAITRCEIDPGDPDAHWRWLAEGIRASTALFDGDEPKFTILTGRIRRPALIAARCHAG